DRAIIRPLALSCSSEVFAGCTKSTSSKHRPKFRPGTGLLRPPRNLISLVSGKILIPCRRGNGAERNLQRDSGKRASLPAGSWIEPVLELSLESLEHLFFDAFDVSELAPTSHVTIIGRAFDLDDELFDERQFVRILSRRCCLQRVCGLFLSVLGCGTHRRLNWLVNNSWDVPKLFQAKSSRKSILISGRAERLMLSLNVLLLKCGATKRCTCVAAMTAPVFIEFTRRSIAGSGSSNRPRNGARRYSNRFTRNRRRHRCRMIWLSRSKRFSKRTPRSHGTKQWRRCWGRTQHLGGESAARRSGRYSFGSGVLVCWDGVGAGAGVTLLV